MILSDFLDWAQIKIVYRGGWAMGRPHGVVGSFDLWDELVGELYEAVLNPGGLTETLKRIDAWMGSSFSHLMAWDDRNNRQYFSIMTDPAFGGAAAQYEQYYGAIDPRRQLSAHQAAGTVWACHDHFNESYVDKSEFYQDLLIPAGARYILAGYVLKENGISAYLAFNHVKAQGYFSDQQKLATVKLMPHVQRAIRLILRNEALRAGLFSGGVSLDALEQAVFTLDSSDRIVSMNQSGKSLLNNGRWLKTRGTRLEASVLNEAANLTLAFARVRLSRQAETIALRGGSDLNRVPEQTQFVTILPVPIGEFRHPLANNSLFDGAGVKAESGGGTQLWSLAAAELVVLVAPQRRQFSMSPASLKTLFGLTAAEARLAHQLARGFTIDEYAANAAISVATARTQLRSIFAKTGEPGLQDLVRMLSALPTHEN